MDSEKKNITKYNFQRENLLYTPYYCEENIYFLCKSYLNIPLSQKLNDKNNAYVIFLTNPTQKTYIKYQKIGNSNQNYLVIWDYHVIFLEKTKESNLIYDFDTLLEFPCDFIEYFNKSINFKKPNETYFRVIDCETFINYFCSDRSHMLNKFTNKYLEKPPSYPSITNKLNEKMNLNNYLNLENNDNNYGKVLNESELYEFFK